MAMNCTGVLYFPITISVLEGIALELIEARFGLKGVAAFIKLLCKVYKEEGYYMSWGKEQCMLFTRKLGNELSYEEIQEIIELLIEKEIFSRKMYAEHHVLTSERIQKSVAGCHEAKKERPKNSPLFPRRSKGCEAGSENCSTGCIVSASNAYN